MKNARAFRAVALTAWLMGITGLHAQTLTVLHTFTNTPDGASTFSGLVLAGGSLFGTARSGGTNNSGIVFAVNTDGSGYRILHDFSSDPNGGSPNAALVVAGDTLYGTTAGGRDQRALGHRVFD